MTYEPPLKRPGDPSDATGAAGASLVNLQAKSGPIQRLVTGIATSGEAGRAARELEATRVAAEVSIGKIAIAVAATKIKTALVARNMPAIGALAAAVGSATAAVDMSLTNGAAANAAAHIANRHRNLSVLEDLKATGKMDEAEAEVLRGHLESDLADDIGSSRRRMTQAKTAVSILHDHALSHIEAARIDPGAPSVA